MSIFYKLEGQKAVPCSTEDAVLLRNSADRRVGLDEVAGKRVSTVFLGVDHNVGGTHPHIFETMVFQSPDSFRDEACWRWSTWEEAAAGHKKVVEWLQAGKPLEDCDPRAT